jgi:hypothetical protein
VAALVAPPLVLTTAKPAGASSSDEAAFGLDLLAYANRERAARGLPALQLDGYASYQAQGWAAQMQATNTLSHRSNFSSAFASYPAAGENVADLVANAGDVHRQFMASPEHRRNILQPGFDAAGLGIACSGDGRVWVVIDYVARSQTAASRYNGGYPAASPQSVSDGGHRCPVPSASGQTVGSAGSGGYWLTARDGGIFSFGDVRFYGSTGGTRLNQPIVAMAATPTKKGYWLAARDGGIFSYGDARFYGSQGGRPLNAPIVGAAAKPAGGGYWLVANDGGIFSYGGSRFYGSRGGQPLNAPIVGMAPTKSGNGYWLVASDGGIFSYGDARFYGSTGGTRLNQPIVAMAATASGAGYWLVARDGGVFSFGDAGFAGSPASLALRPAITTIARGANGGYYLFAADGGVFNYGAAAYRGSTGAIHLNQPIVGGAA